MMSETKHEARQIFTAALALKTSEARARYLDEACRDKPELRQRVEELLLAHDQAGGFLEQTVQVPLPSDIEIEGAGVVIGRYKLLEKIGEGGFGVVYMAEQVEPVQRKVALKIIKAGMDTREVIARFEAERQALALMDHPNIAQVFDGGVTQAGRPYFVMELVRGISITEFCDQGNLSTHGRLELFIQVCQAVQHAHQKAIIHRDLKPTNILVTMIDGKPVPKIIDFGVAKALGQKLTDKTLFTGFLHMVGTPAYMSPEQANLSGVDIDTRADIYALGVLLYELLTGVTPFDAETLRKAALDEVRRMIREFDPPKPSTRLHTLGDKLTQIAKQRHTEPATLGRLVRGDLDWIVMKCLEKDRVRRYETVNALAQDVQQHLQHEPVHAGPPGALYRTRKFVRRHRLGVGAGLALALTVLAGAGVSLWQAVRANQQAALAESRRQEAELHRQAATEARNQAERLTEAVSHQLARQCVDQGAQLLRQGDYFGALVWFTEALQLDEGNSEVEAIHRLRIGAVLQQSPKITDLFRHQNDVFSVEFSPDGQRLATASADETARVWDVNSGKPLTPPIQHTGLVASAGFSPDGLRLVTASLDHTARVWDANTGLALAPAMEHPSEVTSAVFGPEGRRVLTACYDGTARIWDAVSGKLLISMSGHQAIVWPAVFSPDGRLVLTASQDKTARIWNSDTGRPAAPALPHAGKVWWAAFSPDGQRVATASEDHTARVWDAHSGSPLTPPMQHSEEVVYVSFSPDGQRLVTASGEAIFLYPFAFKDRPGEARVWSAITGDPLTPPIPHKLGVFFAAFSPDGRRVVTASRDHTARIWDAQTGTPLIPPLMHQESVFRAVFSPDGRRLATASFDQMARLWKIGGGEQVSALLNESWLAGSLTLSSDGRLVVGKYLGGGARVWNPSTGSPVTPVLHDTEVYHYSLSADGELLATAGADGTARIWNLHTGAAVTSPLRHAGKVFWVEFSPDGRRVVTASEDQTARVWDAQTGAALTPPLRHGSNVLCAVFSPDGRRVASTSDDQTARVWDAATGAAVTPPLVHRDAVRLALFSPDGSHLLTATRNGRTRIWDAETGQAVTPPMQQGGGLLMLNGIESMAFSPDGRHFVIADSDGTARVWDATKGSPVTPPLQHDDMVGHAAFSHSGRYVVTASDDKTARVWDAATGQPITPPLRHEGPVGYAIFTADDRAVKTTGHTRQRGFVGTWKLEPAVRSTKDLLFLAEMLSLHHLDSSGAFTPLDIDALTNASWRLTP